MKELYYYSPFEDEEIKKCLVIKETPKTYVVKIGFWDYTLTKATMSNEKNNRIRVFETEEQAKNSHLEHLKRRIGYLEGEAERCTAKAENYKALVEKLYGGKKRLL